MNNKSYRQPCPECGTKVTPYETEIIPASDGGPPFVSGVYEHCDRIWTWTE